MSHAVVWICQGGLSSCIQFLSKIREKNDAEKKCRSVTKQIAIYFYRKTAVEVAEGLYKQARKRRRAGDIIIPLLEVANADLAYLQ